MKLSQLWATLTNYAAGPDTGTPTKVDPSSSTNGFIRGVAAAAQNVNFVIAPLAETSRRAFTLATLALRPIDCDEQSDTTDGLAVTMGQFAATGPSLLCKGSPGGVVAVGDGNLGESRGVLSQVTDTAVCGARGPTSTRTVVIGAGGTQNCFTTNNGTGWSSGASTGLLGSLASVVATGTNFIVASGAGGSAHGTGAGAWTTATPGSDIQDVCSGGGVSSLAALTGGVVVAVGLDGGPNPKIARSTDGGVTWAAASGAIPNAASQGTAGCVAGDEGATLWHAGHRSFTTVDIAVSTDGNTWTTRATLTASATVSQTRIMKCPLTDLLVVAVQRSVAVEVWASTDEGLTWSESQNLIGFNVANLGVACGRLFGSKGGKLFASDGVGTE